ncbi:MAG: hypothetical protein ACRCWJ_10300 [Casimicrobium sp.]
MRARSTHPSGLRTAIASLASLEMQPLLSTSTVFALRSHVFATGIPAEILACACFANIATRYVDDQTDFRRTSVAIGIGVVA